MLIFLFLSFLIPFPHAFGTECEWWQIKYSAAIVDEHTRNQTTNVKEHPRSEYCKNRWKNADIYIKLFENDPIQKWSFQKEIFKKWTKEEIKIIMQVLEIIPSWSNKEKIRLYRAKTSSTIDNPATSEIKGKNIILYDLFFKNKNKEKILIHEYGHHLFTSLSEEEKNEFASKSGWSLEIDQKRRIFSRPPKKLIKNDSSFNIEEDFSNHLEEYYLNKNNYQKNYQNTYIFFLKRFP